MNTTIAVAVIGAVGIILAAVVAGMFSIIAQRLERFARRTYEQDARVEHKIDGIRDGTMPEIAKALARLREEREIRRIHHLPMRRRGDDFPSIDNPLTEGKVITVDQEGT
jgi:hypothetical protein